MTHLSRLTRLALIAIMAIAIPSTTAALAQDDAETLVLGEALVVGPLAPARRASIHQDSVEAEIVAGTWSVPDEGDMVTLPDDREVRWQAMTADEKGWISDRALRGGYALYQVESATRRVTLLHASGHSMVYVNGEPRAGDPYRTGFVRLPILLEKGPNTLLFKCGRGGVRVGLTEPTSRVMLNTADMTVPHLVADEPIDVMAAIIVLNLTTEPLTGLMIEVSSEITDTDVSLLPDLPPLGLRKVPFHIAGPVPIDEKQEFKIDLLEWVDEKQLIVHDSTTMTIRVKSPAEKHRRTFISGIDGSVQQYALLPAAPPTQESDEPQGLVLTLHGAGVQSHNQAGSYTAKDWCNIVAPTNRRPFGFDWEDWGRLDAIEVLDLASAHCNADPDRTYLTGHSMGGHGTWNLGVTFPGRFAAIAPSAGWISFWSYGGKGRPEADDPVQAIIDRATTASDTLQLSSNYAMQGIYVLHGDRDDNVPVTQARTMREHLAGFHGNFAYYEKIGAGHWWGNRCVDWPPLFQFLQQNVREENPASIDFATASPGVSSTCRWVTIEAQQHPFEVSRVQLKLNRKSRSITGTTTNVKRLSIDVSQLALEATDEAGSLEMAVDLDERPTLVVQSAPGVTTLTLERDVAGDWAVTGPADPESRGPHRYGSFKDAFRHNVMFVFGTEGDEAENAWAFAKARFDAETFWYRGNGSIDVMPDTDFDPAEHVDRGVILYGNADTNAAWAMLLKDSPVQVRRDSITIGDGLRQRSVRGDDLATLFIRPRPDSDIASVGVVSGTGIKGMRLTDRLPYFVSGVGYPDLTVLGPDVLTDGVEGVRVAGWFGNDWSVKNGEIEYRK